MPGQRADWSARVPSDSPFCGNGTYFTTASARVLGNGSQYGTTLHSATFYVTNTTAVRLLGYFGKSNSTSYPTYLRVYECTLNDNGSLNPATSPVKNLEFSSFRKTADLLADGLDEEKIYKVEAGVYRGYLYEIAFQTPLKGNPIKDINKDGLVNVSDVTALVSIILDDDMVPPFIWTEYDHDAADVNGDGIVNITDVTVLVGIILED